MSFTSELSELIKKPQDIVWLIPDKCKETFGVPPCRAANGASNPGLETGDSTGWIIAPNGGGFTGGVNGNDVNSGSYSIEAIYSAVTIVKSIYPDLTIVKKASATFYIDFYLKITGYSAGTFELIIKYYSDEEGLSLISTELLDTWSANQPYTNMTYVSGTDFTIPSNCKSLYLIIYNDYIGGPTTGTLYIDDFYITSTYDTRMCYNTRSTCRNPDNYANLNETELFSNGNFSSWATDDPDNWTLTFTEDANNYIEESPTGEAHIVADGNLASVGLKQYTLTKGLHYKFVVEVTDVTSGSLIIKIGSSGGTLKTLDSVGYHQIYFTAYDADQIFIVNADDSSACDITIDNASLKQINAIKLCRLDLTKPLKGEVVRPYLKRDPKYLATELNPEKSLTVNAKVTLEMSDELDNDVGIDPYVTDRSSFPNIPGTFWRKFIARNTYYLGRTILIKKGFESLKEYEYETSKYIIDQIDIDKDGTIRIVAKDLLKRADRVKVPEATGGKVTDNPLTDSATTINCDDTSEYEDSGYIRIDDEIIQYSSKTSTSFTVASGGRGSFGTTAAEHDEDEKIQMCYVQQNQSPTDIVLDILKNYVGIAEEDIDTNQFTTEESAWLTAFTFTGIVSEPTKASELLEEIQEQTMSNIWWSEEEQKIKFKVIAPGNSQSSVLTDNANILDIKINNNEKSRISRLVIYYGRDVVTEDLDEPSAYANALIDWDNDAEGSDQYGEKATKTIYSRWIPAGSQVPTTLASRYRRSFRDPPREIIVTLDLKDYAKKTGDFADIETSFIQGIDGSELRRTYLIKKKRQRRVNQFEYTMLDTAWSKKYGNIAPDGQPDWDSASASEQEYVYICDDNEGLGSSDDDAFYIF